MHNHATLDTLTALETAVRELRHAILTDQDTSLAHDRITAAVTDLAQQLTTEPAPPAPADPPVTNRVTKSQAHARPASQPLPAATHEPPTSAAEKPPARVVRTVDLRDQIGPGWTLVQHEDEADAAIWHVQHDGHAVGTVRRDFDLATNTPGWEARTAQFDHVPAVGTFAASRRTDRLWRTRDIAAAGIAARADRPGAGTATRRRRSG